MRWDKTKASDRCLQKPWCIELEWGKIWSFSVFLRQIERGTKKLLKNRGEQRIKTSAWNNCQHWCFLGCLLIHHYFFYTVHLFVGVWSVDSSENEMGQKNKGCCFSVSLPLFFRSTKIAAQKPESHNFLIFLNFFHPMWSQQPIIMHFMNL